MSNQVSPPDTPSLMDGGYGRGAPTSLERRFDEVGSPGKGHSGCGMADKAALDSGLLKLLAFVQADKGNAVALTTVFVRHERLERDRGGDPGAGLPLAALVAEFDSLGVGFSSAEVGAFLAAHDINGDGKMSLPEFTQVLAAANASKKARRR